MLTEKLTALRKAKGLSQSELAEKLDVSRQAVSRWETGDAAPGIENLKGLRDLYGVTIDYLLSDKDGEEPAPAPVPEPEPTEAQRAPVPVRPRRTVIALLSAALAVAVLVIILLLLPRQTQEKTDPADVYNGPSPVHGEEGRPIEGRGLRGYEEYELDLVSVERRANAAGGGTVAVLSAVDSLTVSATGYSEGRSAAGFVLEAGESVLVKGAYSQFSASVKYGLIDANGVFYGVEGYGGLLDYTFRVKESGTYYFAVVNNSPAPFSLSGYLYFWLFS